jgi:hypothetical protein
MNALKALKARLPLAALFVGSLVACAHMALHTMDFIASH